MFHHVVHDVSLFLPCVICMPCHFRCNKFSQFVYQCFMYFGLFTVEIMVVAHSNCGACHMSFGHFREEMLRRGITEDTLAGIKDEGVDLDEWLEGFHDPEASVRDTVSNIRNHPLMPQDITVRGFIMDSATGALTEIK